MLACQPQHQLGIERFCEAGVRDRGRQALGRQYLRGRETFRKPGAKRQQRHRTTLAQDAPLPDFQRHAELGHLDTHAVAARIA